MRPIPHDENVGRSGDAACTRVTMRHMSIWQRFADTAERFHDRPAIEVDGGQVSYAELLDRAKAVAGQLVLLGKRGDRCAVLSQRSVSGYAAFLGCQLAGFTYVPLSAADPPARHAMTMGRIDCGLLIVDEQSAKMAPAITGACATGGLVLAPAAVDCGVIDTRWRSVELPLHSNFSDDPAATPDDPAYVIFTSGSTGVPKGVVVSNRSVLHYTDAIGSVFRLQPDDRATQLFDPGFDLAMHDMLVTWFAGACLVPFGQQSSFRAGQAIRDLAITSWFSVPSSIGALAKLGQVRPDYLSGLRTSLFCGEALTGRDAAMWQAATPGGKILNLYGPTEATIAVSTYRFRPEDADAAIVPIGRPLPGSAFCLIDPETGNPVADGHEGELGIEGAQLANGYWQDQDLTERRFRTFVDDGSGRRVYLTGDRAKCIDGVWKFLGRLDSEIKIGGGYRVNLLEVEALVADAAQAAAVVVAVPHATTGALKLEAFVQTNPRPVAELRSILREHAPGHMIPQAFHWVEHFPRLSNDKVDRRALVSQILADREAEAR
jgi:amino acid adenylation domain-containing protein